MGWLLNVAIPYHLFPYSVVNVCVALYFLGESIMQFFGHLIMDVHSFDTSGSARFPLFFCHTYYYICGCKGNGYFS